jgi:hypothetical protein
LPPAQQVFINRPPQNNVPGVPVPINGGGRQIRIVNPADSGGEVQYSLNGTAYSIRPGYGQVIDNDRQWVISFGSGGIRGDVRYTLAQGTFKFKVLETGWELVRAADQPAFVQGQPPTNSPTFSPTLAPAPVPAPVP